MITFGVLASSSLAFKPLFIKASSLDLPNGRGRNRSLQYSSSILKMEMKEVALEQ